MKEMAAVLDSVGQAKAVRDAAKRAFLLRRAEIWQAISEGRLPSTYTSSHGRRFVGAPRRSAVRSDFLLANKIALGSKYAKDRLADSAQRDFLFYVLREREVFPERSGKKFYCCPKCTSKLHECVSAKVFRYIDNAKWKAQIERA